MATNLRTPGVYVQEITTLSASIAGVDTAIPAFVGYVQKAERDGEGIPMFTPVRIASFLEYESIFGGPDPQGFNINIADVSVGGNVTRTVSVNKTAIPESNFRMYYNLSMYFANGGGPCWIVPVGFYALASTVSENDLKEGLNALEKESEPTILLFPDALSLIDSQLKNVNNAAIDQCNKLKNRFTILDVKQVTPATPLIDAENFRNDMTGIDTLNYAAAYYPYLNTTMNYGTSSLLLQVSGYSSTVNGTVVPTPAGFALANEFNGEVTHAIQGTINALNYLKVATTTLTSDDATAVQTLVTAVQANITAGISVVLLAPFDGLIADLTAVNSTEMAEATSKADEFADTNGQTLAKANALKIALSTLLDALNGVMDGLTTAYNATTTFIGGNVNYLQNSRPSIYSDVISGLNGFRVTLNPSGAMAGIYARVDNSKGVWQAPANVGVRNVIGPAVLVTNEQQGAFNIDSLSGKSINVIRNFTGRGTIPWGARTLDGNSNEWRYVNVRRLFIYLEESIKRSSQFVVFEPNDANTWIRTKGMISNFLTDVWRNGGLVGATAEEAYFVNVGLGTSMTTMDVLEGRMIIEIGVAAVRPAEFIILRFTHFVQE